MKKSTLLAQGTAGIAVMAVLTALVHADTASDIDINQLEIDMENAALTADALELGQITEVELETCDSKAIWEVDIVNAENQKVSVEIDGHTGEILSTRTDGSADSSFVDAMTLTQALGIVKAVENGSFIEAELEMEEGTLFWEVESMNIDNQETKYWVNAETGEILI